MTDEVIYSFLQPLVTRLYSTNDLELPQVFNQLPIDFDELVKGEVFLSKGWAAVAQRELEPNIEAYAEIGDITKQKTPRVDIPGVIHATKKLRSRSNRGLQQLEKLP